MPIDLVAVATVPVAGAAPVRAQPDEDTVLRAVIDNGCELNRAGLCETAN